MSTRRGVIWSSTLAVGLALFAFSALAWSVASQKEEDAVPPMRPVTAIDRQVETAAQTMIDRGRAIFRTSTFRSQSFFGGVLRLHEAVAKVPPKTALAVGLKVDADAVPPQVLATADLDDPATTIALLRLNAVV